MVKQADEGTTPMGKEDVWIPSVCGQCYSNCGILGHRVDNTLIKIEGNPESPTARGRVCPRGASGPMLLYDPNRANVPLKRTNPQRGIDVDPGWVEISWEEALDTIAEKLRKIRADDPRKLFMTGTVSAMDQTNVAQPFASAFGALSSRWVSGAGNHCGNAEHLFGAILHCAWAKQPDTEYCNYLLNFGVPVGFGAYYAAPAMAQRIADARNRGMRHVVIDPFLSPTAEKGDEWIPIRPGTDGALALAMMNVLLHELSMYDRDYLKHHTNGPYLIGEDGHYVRDKASGKPLVWDSLDGKAKTYDDGSVRDFALEGHYEVDGVKGRPGFALLKDHVTPFTPEWAEPITTVPAATTRRITKEFGEAARIGSTIVIDGVELPYRPAALMYFKGAQGHKNATLTSMALELLLELVGASNVPGGVLGANSRILGYPGTGLPSWGPVAGPDGLLAAEGSGRVYYPVYPGNGAQKPVNIGLGDMIPTIVASPGITPMVMQNPERFGIPYRIEMSLNVGSNYLMTANDPEQIAAAFDGVFQVTSALYLNEVTYLSDIVLPEASYLERYSVNVDWGAINAPTGEWVFHLRQPIVDPMHKRRNFAEVILELAERLDMREEVYAVLNVGLGVKGTKHELDPSQKYSLEEIIDLRYKALFGDEHGLEWFKEHGVLKWPKRLEEVYWKAFVQVRVPIYFEWFLQVKEEVDKLVQELGVEDLIDTSAFKALPEWNPCPSHEEKRSEYDLFATYYRVPFHTFSATYNNPWLDEVSRIDPYAYTVALNIETARRKGINDGDRVEITSAGTGHTINARARVTEGIHPEVLVMVNAGGHWSKFTPIASAPDKGACFEWMMPLDVKYLDIPSMNWDVCSKVKVSRSEG